MKISKILSFLPFLVIIVFAVLRFVNLTAVPIFTDEAIYIRWTQIARLDPAWRFISLTDGKQPLYIWFNIISQNLITDPLLAGRIISVLAGLFSIIGMYFTGSLLFNKKTAIWAALIWSVFPFAFWHERLAMMDSLLACFTIWALYMQIKLVKKPTIKISVILGVVMGLGLLTKSSALFSIILLALNILLFKVIKKQELIKFIKLAFLSVIIAQIISNIQRLSPFYYIVGQKNLTFIYSVNEIIGFSLQQTVQRFWGNLTALISWSASYLTSLICLVLIIPFIKFKQDFKKKLYLVSWFLIPFVGLAFWGKVIYPRFILFMMPPLILLVSLGINTIAQLKNKLLGTLGLIIIFSLPLYFVFQIVFNPVQAPLPNVDRGQYLDDWPSGWGINKVIAYLADKSKNEKISVATEGTFGLTPYALEIYLYSNKNIEIKGFWPLGESISWLKEKSSQKPTFLLLKDTQIPNPAWPLNLVFKVKRGNGDNYLGFYQFK